MRKENTKIQTKFISEAGSFLRNADYFAFVELEDSACYCIADGIDEDAKKESAKAAVTAVIESFQAGPRCSRRCLGRCLQSAHSLLKEETGDIRLEASIVVLVTDYKKMMWASAGNARMYHIRNNVVKNQTADQSLSQGLAEQGRVPVDKVGEHEERHNLYCYLGQPEKFRPFFSKKVKLMDADIVLLCTRGVWENIGMAELLDSVEEAKEPGGVCSSMEEAILSQQRKQLSNYTLACIFLDKVYRDPGKKKKAVKWIVAAAVVLLVVAVVVGVTVSVQRKKRRSAILQMLEYKENGRGYVADQNFARASKEFEEAVRTARKIRMKEDSEEYKEREELDQYKKLAEQMVDAEEAMEKKDYKKAAAFYELATKEQKYLPSSGEEDKAYIEGQKQLAVDYLEVLQNIRTGDKKASVEDYAGAEESYQKALDTATDIYYVDGKEESSTKLADVQAKQFGEKQGEKVRKADEYTKKAEKAAEAGESGKAAGYYKKARELYKEGGAEDKASQMQEKVEGIQEEQAAGEQKELAAEADKCVKEGDRQSDLGEYKEAVASYYMAVDLYTQAKQSEAIPSVQTKIEVAETRNTATIQQENQASDYQLKADEKLKQEDYESAAVLYSLAQDIYRELGMDTEKNAMKKKVKKMKGLAAAEAADGGGAGSTGKQGMADAETSAAEKNAADAGFDATEKSTADAGAGAADAGSSAEEKSVADAGSSAEEKSAADAGSSAEEKNTADAEPGTAESRSKLN